MKGREITRHYYKDAIKFRENCEKDNYDVPFTFRYFCDNGTQSYDVEYDGTNYTNCAPDENGGIIVLISGQNIGYGQLKCEKTFYSYDGTIQNKKVIATYIATYPIELSPDLEHYCEVKEVKEEGVTVVESYEDPEVSISYGGNSISNNGCEELTPTIQISQRKVKRYSNGREEYETANYDINNEGVEYSFETDLESVNIDSQGRITLPAAVTLDTFTFDVQLSVTINDKTGSGVVSLTQEAATLSIDNSEFNEVDADGADLQVVITKSDGIVINEVSSNNFAIATASLNESTLDITVTPNNSVSARSANITISTNVGERIIGISQEAATISLSDTSLSESANSKTKTVTVTKSAGITLNSVESSNNDIATASLDGNTISISVKANPTAQTRTAEITLTTNVGDYKISLLQEAASWSIGKTEVSANANGKSDTVTITKTEGVQITTVESSDSAVAAASLSGNTVTITVSKSATASARSATVTIASNLGSKTISVSQTGATCSFSNQTQGEGANNNKQVSATIVGTVTLTSASSNQTWVTASVSGTKVILNIAKTDTADARTATITVSTSIGDKTFTLTQSGATIYDIYIGHKDFSSIKTGITEFAALTQDELIGIANKTFNSSPASETCDGMVHFMIVKEGLTINKVTLKAALETVWNNKEWEDSNVWKFTHTDLIIFGKTYHVYGYGSASLSGNTMIVEYSK